MEIVIQSEGKKKTNKNGAHQDYTHLREDSRYLRCRFLRTAAVVACTNYNSCVHGLVHNMNYGDQTVETGGHGSGDII